MSPRVMSPPALSRIEDDPVRRVAYAVLLAAVRGRREQGGVWGEAALGEFHRTTGRREALRWTAGGLRAVWQERRNRVRELPRLQRLGRRVAVIAVLGLLGGLVVNRFLLTVDYEPSGAMAPTVSIGDRYLTDKVGFRLTGLHRGDIVQVELPHEPGSPSYSATKRVIGLPGDTIECRGGRVYRDGSLVDEPYVSADDSPTDCTPLTVPAGTVYLLGDHREMSMDSRHWGPLGQRSVVGRFLVRVWPPRTS